MAGGRLTVAVQHRFRLLREGLSQLLAASDDVSVVGLAETFDDLLRICRTARPGVAFLEVDPRTDIKSDAYRLKRAAPGVTIMGLLPSRPAPADRRRARDAGLAAVTSQSERFVDILVSLRAAADPCGAAWISAASGAAARRSLLLSDDELAVLTLLGAGHSAHQTAARLGIRPTAVEANKHQIFTKLGVQNCAGAVSVAMRRGLLLSCDVLGMAVEE